MTTQTQLAVENFALFDSSGVLVGGLSGVIDLSPSITHRKSVSVTSKPVESGSSLTDNAVKEPVDLQISSIVSDQIITADTRLNVPTQARAGTAWGIISALQDRLEPITVVTQLERYTNMLITDLSDDQGRNTGLGLVMTISLSEVRFAETKLVKFPPVSVSGPATNKTSTVNRGDQQSTVLSEEEEQAIRNNL